MASKMLHTCLRVENLEKSIAFYQDAFGFKELRRRDFPDHAFTIVYLGLEPKCQDRNEHRLWFHSKDQSPPTRTTSKHC